MAKLLLFDIDGTLMRAYGAGSRAMLRAAMSVLGERCDGARIDVGGALDPWIFRELARHGGYEPSDELHQLFRRSYVEELLAQLAHPDQRCEAMPGVLELLAQLRRERPAILGMLTGNYPETGAIKLRRVGIEAQWFSPSVWGDAAEDRPALVRCALAHTQEVAACDVIVIGDTPRDVHCAHANGARCLAVATGGFSEAELRAAGADQVLGDLRDPSPLYEMIED